MLIRQPTSQPGRTAVYALISFEVVKLESYDRENNIGLTDEQTEWKACGCGFSQDTFIKQAVWINLLYWNDITDWSETKL